MVSQAQAMESPAPTHQPSTAAMMGSLPPTIRRIMRWERRIRSRPCSAVVTSMPEMSPPEQKMPSAPVSTMARTPASPCTASMIP